MKKKGKDSDGKFQQTPVIIPFDMDPISADPFGSYTGVPEDLTEKPVQDADDL